MGYKNIFYPGNIRISLGNTKVGDVSNFSLSPHIGCGPYSRFCCRICYAMKAYRQYKHVKNAWDRNLDAAKTADGCFQIYEAICAFLTKYEPELFRVHVSGDFISQQYLDTWNSIYKEFPRVSFLAFSKSFNLNFSNTPRNTKNIWSVVGGMPIDIIPKIGSRAYAGRRSDYTDIIRQGEIVRRCPGRCDTCGKCWKLKNTESVVFPLH